MSSDKPVLWNNANDESDWIPVPDAGRRYCKFCRQLAYWKKQNRKTDQYGNVIYAPPCEARLSEDGTLEYREIPHKRKR